MKQNKSNVIDQELLNAYKQAVYSINSPAIVFKIGIKNTALSNLLSDYQSSCAYFITAYNPKSVLLSKAENQQRHQKLKQVLKQGNFAFLEGQGADEQKKWPAEKSFLVFNTSKDKMLQLAHTFEQNAIVSICEQGIAQLLLC